MLTGLGDRSHLSSPEVDLGTHVQDVANVLFYEDLTDAILAGHSYGGMVVTGVAGRMPERLRRLVYLDAFVPEDGQSLFDLVGAERAASMRARAAADGDGWRVPAVAPPPDAPRSLPRQHPQPIRTLDRPIRLPDGPIRLPRTDVHCTAKDPDASDPFRQFADRVKADPAWTYREIATGHNLQHSAVDETVELLLEAARA